MIHTIQRPEIILQIRCWAHNSTTMSLYTLTLIIMSLYTLTLYYLKETLTLKLYSTSVFQWSAIVGILQNQWNNMVVQLTMISTEQTRLAALYF